MLTFAQMLIVMNVSTFRLPLLISRAFCTDCSLVLAHHITPWKSTHGLALRIPHSALLVWHHGGEILRHRLARFCWWHGSRVCFLFNVLREMGG